MAYNTESGCPVSTGALTSLLYLQQPDIETCQSALMVNMEETFLNKRRFNDPNSYSIICAVQHYNIL